jgi:hypothetical protein
MAIVLGPLVHADASVSIVRHHFGFSAVGANDENVENLPQGKKVRCQKPTT